MAHLLSLPALLEQSIIEVSRKVATEPQAIQWMVLDTHLAAVVGGGDYSWLQTQRVLSTLPKAPLEARLLDEETPHPVREGVHR